MTALLIALLVGGLLALAGRAALQNWLTRRKSGSLLDFFEGTKKALRTAKLNEASVFEALAEMAKRGGYQAAADRLSGDNMPPKKSWTEAEFQAEVTALVRCFQGAYSCDKGILNALENIEALSKNVH